MIKFMAQIGVHYGVLGAQVKVTKEKFLSAMSSVEDFEVMKSERNYPDDDTVILAKWKGQSLFVMFNEKKIPKEISDNDDVNATVSFDYAISLIVLAKKTLCDLETSLKYKIANYTNMKSDYASVVIYREDLDLFTVDVRHNVFSRNKTPQEIKVSFISMVLSGVVTSELLREQIKACKDSPEEFLKNCMGQ
ncbi:hypothetical protein [Enterobacter hormaechei]|uniref:hypothetical protein n=1 Tax=Enterobacter hormaechei TaxID=158836 RepID=UPI0012B8A15B|nr:hypothetical protein [Enterobacter hormaechei]